MNHTAIPRRLTLLTLVLLLGATGPRPGLAQDDVPAKRGEGRYFVDLAEIMISSEDFDVILGQDDPLGPRAGDPAQQIVAALPQNELGSPKVTIGLNRPSGKSAFSVSFHDFDIGDQRVPQNFDREGVVFTSDLMLPGIVFQRQAQPSDARTANFEIDDDFVPNWANEWAFRRGVSYQSGAFTYERNMFENERFRFRWMGGVRYALLRETLAHATSFAKEAGIGQDGGVTTVERQDFFFVNSNVTTRGIGPLFGFDGRWLLGKDKRWSIDGNVELALIPESTTAKYEINLADQSTELFVLTFMQGDTQTIINRVVSEQPVVPGIDTPLVVGHSLFPFQASAEQQDFTDQVYLLQAQLGFRWQANKYFSVGLDAWHMRWMNVLSLTDALAQIRDTAQLEYIQGSASFDPQLQDDEAIIRVGRFSGRQDFGFDGLSLNLGFTF